MKRVLYFLVGAATGGCIAHYLTKDAITRKKDEERQSVIRYYDAEIKRREENAVELFNKTKNAEEAMKTYRDGMVQLSLELAKYTGAEAKTTVDDIPFGDEEASEDDDEEDDIDPAELEFPIEGEEFHVNDPEKSLPYRITEEMWAEEGFGFFDKISLVYYLKDDTLLSEIGELVDDVYKTIGTDWEEDLCEEGDEVYIRNEFAGADYYIVAKDEWGFDNIKEADLDDD